MAKGLRLTPEEKAMLAGEEGPGVQKAMEIVVALGQIYGAADLIPIASAQVSGVSYKNLGDAGLTLLQEWAATGARARVPAMLNPAGMDLGQWRELGFSEGFARRQQAVLGAYTALGITPTCTCTPYLVGFVPHLGQSVAWAESSAVSYVNSVLGARTNREGGPSALASAITGRTARYGLHLDEKRRATAIVEVHCPVRTEADLGALGYLVGRQIQGGIPYFRFSPSDWNDSPQALKALGAAMAASGAVALYHVEGVTPEAQREPMVTPGVPTIVVQDLAAAYAALNESGEGIETIDLVSLGCPHASEEEIQAIADYLDGRRVKAALWITTSRTIRQRAEARGVVARLEAAGARVVADTCLIVAPVKELGFRTLATNSAKMAFYAPSHSGLAVRFGPTERCLEAALSGRW